MEIGFIIIMLGLVVISSTYVYVSYAHSHRKCGNCKFFRYCSYSKYRGTCLDTGAIHLPLEQGCDNWKRKPIKALEGEE